MIELPKKTNVFQPLELSNVRMLKDRYFDIIKNKK